jgi:hypothetical protein
MNRGLWNISPSDRPLLNNGRGQALLRRDRVRVLARVLKFGICGFPSVFECPRVLLLAINAHEII